MASVKVLRKEAAAAKKRFIDAVAILEEHDKQASEARLKSELSIEEVEVPEGADRTKYLTELVLEQNRNVERSNAIAATTGLHNKRRIKAERENYLAGQDLVLGERYRCLGKACKFFLTAQPLMEKLEAIKAEILAVYNEALTFTLDNMPKTINELEQNYSSPYYDKAAVVLENISSLAHSLVHSSRAFKSIAPGVEKELKTPMQARGKKERDELISRGVGAVRYGPSDSAIKEQQETQKLREAQFEKKPVMVDVVLSSEQDIGAEARIAQMEERKEAYREYLEKKEKEK